MTIRGTGENMLLDFDPTEIARQITLNTFDTYARIKMTELFNQSWTKQALQHRSPNVLKMIAEFNRLAGWVGTCILSQKTLKTRVHVFEALIKIAQALKEIKNFQALMAFVSGLNNCAVQRLKWTRAKLSKKSVQVKLF